MPARFFSPPKVIFPAQGAARGFAQQTQGRSRGLEKLPRAVKKTKGSAQGLNVAFHTWCLENVVFVGVDIPKILLAAGQREEIDEQLPSGLIIDFLYTILTAIITLVLTSFIIIARTKRYADCFPLFDCLPVPTNLKSRNIEIIRRAEKRARRAEKRIFLPGV